MQINSIRVGTAIRAMMMEHADLVGLVGNKIYPVMAKQDVNYPFVVYRRAGLDPAYTKQRYADECTVYVDVVVVAAGYEESLNIAQMVVSALSRRGEFAGVTVRGSRLTDSVDYVDDESDGFSQGLSFEMIINI